MVYLKLDIDIKRYENYQLEFFLKDDILIKYSEAEIVKLIQRYAKELYDYLPTTVPHEFTTLFKNSLHNEDGYALKETSDHSSNVSYVLNGELISGSYKDGDKAEEIYRKEMHRRKFNGKMENLLNETCE